MLTTILPRPILEDWPVLPSTHSLVLNNKELKALRLSPELREMIADPDNKIDKGQLRALTNWREIIKSIPKLEGWPLQMPPITGSSPTVLFAETTEATYGTQFWTSITGSVTRDTTAARDPLGKGSWKCDSGAGNATAQANRYLSPLYAGRIEAYFYFADLPSSTVKILTNGYTAVRLTSTGVLQLWYGAGQIGSNGSTLSINVLYRLCLTVDSVTTTITAAKLFKDGTEDISATGLSVSRDYNIYFGWQNEPGANKVLNFSHPVVDDDTSLTDFTGPGYGLYATAKLPAAVNNNQYTTTGGTGAINERPLSETNYKAELGKTAYLQDYTLQTAAVGDVDLTVAGVTLIAHDGWMWYMCANAKASLSQALVLNGSTYTCPKPGNGTKVLFNKFIDSANYPSNAQGIGQQSTGDSDDIYLYECGVIIVYKKLEVPPTGPTGVKTINDLAIASVKTINDLAIGSVKTINDAA